MWGLRVSTPAGRHSYHLPVWANTGSCCWNASVPLALKATVQHCLVIPNAIVINTPPLVSIIFLELMALLEAQGWVFPCWCQRWMPSWSCALLAWGEHENTLVLGGAVHGRGDIAGEMQAGTHGQSHSKGAGSQTLSNSWGGGDGWPCRETLWGFLEWGQGLSIPELFQALVHYSPQTDVINETSCFM